MKVVSVLAIALLGLVASVSGKPDKLVCYFGSWATYRVGGAKYEVEDIDPFLCTHAVYSFIGLEPSLTGDIKVLDPWNDLPDGGGRAGFWRFNQLKRLNPDLKTLISIGGWGEGTDKFSKVFADVLKRAVFVKSASSFLAKYAFDGLDIDWQFPRIEDDKSNFVAVLKELQTEFSTYGYLLTAVIPGLRFKQMFDINSISVYLDFINVMTYDYVSSYESQVNVHSPLDRVQTTIEDLIAIQAPPEKLNLGIALYGRSFTTNGTCFVPGCLANGPGTTISLQEPGLLGYYEICLIEKSGTKVWSADSQVPYMFWNDQWIGYDDMESAKLKVDLLKKYNLTGVMVWSVDTDDFHANCGNGKNPMLTTLKKEIFS